jgi:tetratricopeptide (TPR) repeat protein
MAIKSHQKIVRSLIALFFVSFVASTLVSCLSSDQKKEFAKEYAAIGYSFYELKQYDKAVYYFNKALNYDPKTKIGSFELAKTYTENKEYAKSLAIVKQLCAKDPENVLLLSLMAYNLLSLDKTDEAKSEYEKVLKLSPHSVDALYNMAIIDVKQGNFGQAESGLKTILTQNPKDKDAILQLAYLCFAQDKPSPGIDYLYAYLAIDADNAKVLVLLGQKLMDAKEYAKAGDAFAAALKKKDADPDALFGSARLAFLTVEDVDKSLELFKKAVAAGYANQDEMDAFIKTLPEDRQAEFALVEPTQKPSSTPGGSPTPEASPNGSDTPEATASATASAQ